MGSDVLKIEKAKDGNYTCKVEKSQQEAKYIYSKYQPLKHLPVPDIEEDKECIILLGLGLGYELNELEKKTQKKIFVIDKNKMFYDAMLEHEELRKILIQSHANFLFGGEYKQLTELDKLANAQIILNNRVIELDKDFFYEAFQILLQHAGQSAQLRRKILFFQHITIAEDCINALESIGYDVVQGDYIHNLSDNEIANLILKEMPYFIFTINFYSKISEISKKLHIPYISWTVDTPNYNLYQLDVLNNNNLIFIYDQEIAKQLKILGVKYVFDLPVAANTDRLDSVVLNKKDVLQYQAEISFLGTTGTDNEFNQYSHLFNEQMIGKIYESFRTQTFKNSKFLVENSMYKQLTSEMLSILKQHQIDYSSFNLPFLSKEEALAFHLGKKYNELERVELVRFLSGFFDVKVYGDDSWQQIAGHRLTTMGVAEHFTEMPKVFQCSKINLNITRVYVDSGLPMRVFDVLGSKGFLVTNDKSDLNRYFKNNQDLVIYRDKQDLLEIIRYFLSHESERQSIIYSGYLKVKNEHTYTIRLKQMMSIVEPLLQNGNLCNLNPSSSYDF